MELCSLSFVLGFCSLHPGLLAYLMVSPSSQTARRKPRNVNAATLDHMGSGYPPVCLKFCSAHLPQVLRILFRGRTTWAHQTDRVPRGPWCFSVLTPSGMCRISNPFQGEPRRESPILAQTNWSFPKENRKFPLTPPAFSSDAFKQKPLFS